MPTPSPKPSSPIPCSRSRAQTIEQNLEQAWPPSHHPLSGPFLPLQPLVDEPSSAKYQIMHHLEELPALNSNADDDSSLDVVDAMRLQVVRDENGDTIGMQVVDFNNDMGKDANICAPLPLGPTNTGVVFSVGSAHAIHSAFTRAMQMSGSKRIMGIMFAPPNEHGMVQDVDWSFLEPVDDCNRDSSPKPANDYHDAINDTRTEDGFTTEVYEPTKDADDAMEPIQYRHPRDSTKSNTEEATKFEDPEVEDTGIKLHHMIKGMLLQAKQEQR